MRFADREVSRVFTVEYWWRKLKTDKEGGEESEFECEDEVSEGDEGNVQVG